MQLNKILYIGTGLDIYITRQLNETSEFIFVDSQPRNSYDDNIRFRKSLYNNSFLNKLINILSIKLSHITSISIGFISNLNKNKNNSNMLVLFLPNTIGVADKPHTVFTFNESIIKFKFIFLDFWKIKLLYI